MSPDCDLPQARCACGFTGGGAHAPATHGGWQGASGGARAPTAHFRRLSGWDYTKGASFFITLTLEERCPLFGSVVEGAMRLSPLGEVVLESLEAIPRFHPELTIHGHVVMPDHVHFNCHLAAGLEKPLRLLGQAIAGFKAATTHAAFPQAQCACSFTEASAPGSGGASAPRLRLWRLGYHDHLCLSRRFIDSTERYIAYNPLKWELMHGSGALRIHEPLFSPRLDPAEYWKGVGNLGLLDSGERLVSLRVSRKVRDIAAVVARMEKASDLGYTVISGFVSKGEQAVRDALCRRRGAKLIRMRPSCIPNARFKPESAYAQAFAEGRCLELGRGNEEVAFDRGACLDLNAEVVRIATAGPGLALYFTENGLVKLGTHP